MSIPISGFSKDSEALFSICGFTIVQWGQAEQSLELVCVFLFKKFGGNTLAKNNELPKMLKNKINFARKCFNHNTELISLKTDALEMLTLFEKLGEIRHEIVHGAITDLEPVNGYFEFNRLEHSPQDYRVTPYRLSAIEFPDFAKNLVRLGTLSATLVHQLIALYEAKRR